MEKQHYVYALFRPDNGRIFYIGMGQGNRAWDHVPKRYQSQVYKNRVVCYYIDELGYPDIPVVIIRDGLTRDEAALLETLLIRAIGRGSQGPLTNMTDGGDGGVNDGYAAMDKMSLEWRAKQSARTKGKPKSPEHRAKIAAALRGRKPTPQCLESVSKANKSRTGITQSKETIEKRVEKLRGRKQPENVRRMLEAANEERKGKPLPKEIRNKISASLKGVPHGKEWNAKVSAALKGKRKTEEHKAKISVTKKTQAVIRKGDGNDSLKTDKEPV